MKTSCFHRFVCNVSYQTFLPHGISSETASAILQPHGIACATIRHACLATYGIATICLCTCSHLLHMQVRIWKSQPKWSSAAMMAKPWLCLQLSSKNMMIASGCIWDQHPSHWTRSFLASWKQERMLLSPTTEVSKIWSPKGTPFGLMPAHVMKSASQGSPRGKGWREAHRWCKCHWEMQPLNAWCKAKGPPSLIWWCHWKKTSWSPSSCYSKKRRTRNPWSTGSATRNPVEPRNPSLQLKMKIPRSELAHDGGCGRKEPAASSSISLKIWQPMAFSFMFLFWHHS